MAPPSRHLNISDAIQVDCHIWKACAGTSVDVVQPPPARSLVYYFPQGHAEHADRSPVNFSARVYSKPIIRCRVVSVRYLARPDTDEVFARVRLIPINSGEDDNKDNRAVEEDDDDDEEEEEEGRVKWFSKVLTSSDANNGGGFSMPKACSDIFPKLDFQADPPVQQLKMYDLKGKIWEFRHIYRGTPLRHLLTTGWSRFVNSKNLIHGDSVVFIRDTRNQNLFISVRRANSHTDNNYPALMTTNLPSEAVEEVMDFGTGFSRRSLGKVAIDEVIEAAELAAAGEEFEIVYYPGGGFSNFVVNAELVDRTLRFPWSLNVKVIMNMETEDQPARNGIVKGTVVALSGYDTSELWDVSSPWRMLKIHWEDTRVSQTDEWRSPWEVEIDNQPSEANGTPEAEIVSSITAAPPRFKLNIPKNRWNGSMGIVIRDNEPGTNVPSSGITSVYPEATNAAEDGTAAQNGNISRGPVSLGNNAQRRRSIKLFGKIISYDVSA